MRRNSPFVLKQLIDVLLFSCGHVTLYYSDALSVRRSVRRSVRPSRLCKNRVSRLFLATVRSYTETNDQPTCFESLSIRLFVHLSVHTYMSHDQYTLRHSPDASLPGRACFLFL